MAWDDLYPARAPMPTSMPEPPRRPRTMLVAGVVVTVLLAAGGAVAWVLVHGDNPKTVDLPRAEETSATARYLHGGGKVIVDFWRQTKTVDGASPVECRALAERLAKASTPPELISRAQAIPEPATRDAVLAHVSAVTAYLGACGANDGVSSAADDVRYTGTVVGRLFERAGL